MKKLVAAALLSFVAVGWSTSSAQAGGCDSCLHKLFHPCCHNCATLCVRPYNAFSPSAFGSLCLDGCTPFAGFNGGNGGGYGGGCNGGFLPPTPYGGPGCCGAEGFGQYPMNGQTIMLPPTTVPAAGGPAYTAPTPAPLPAVVSPSALIYPQQQPNPLMNGANYRPTFNPGYNVNPMMQAPAQGNAFPGR